MADKTSSRNTKLNYYIDENGTINSIADYKASKKDTTINLLRYDDAIQVTGEDISNSEISQSIGD